MDNARGLKTPPEVVQNKMVLGLGLELRCARSSIPILLSVTDAVAPQLIVHGLSPCQCSQVSSACHLPGFWM